MKNIVGFLLLWMGHAALAQETLDLQKVAFTLNGTEQVTIGKLRERTQERLGMLEKYIGVLTERPADWERQNRAIGLASKLFTDCCDRETVAIEVSSINRPNDPPVRYSPEAYFIRLKNLNYSKIEVKFAEIAIYEFRKGAGGKYYGYAVVGQTFVGYKDGRIAYQDRTNKHIEITIDIVQYYEDGKLKDAWDVKLGNVSVIATKTL